MRKYRIQYDTRVEYDIRDAVNYYNSRLPGLGKRFYLDVKDAYKAIQTVMHFQIRYSSVRCFPLKKFPYMVHYSIDDVQQIITIRAIINCYQNPGTSWLVNEP